VFEDENTKQYVGGGGGEENILSEQVKTKENSIKKRAQLKMLNLLRVMSKLQTLMDTRKLGVYEIKLEILLIKQIILFCY